MESNPGPEPETVRTAMRERDADSRRDQEASPEQRIMDSPDMGEDEARDEKDDQRGGR
jgi:hypothetical protein